MDTNKVVEKTKKSFAYALYPFRALGLIFSNQKILLLVGLSLLINVIVFAVLFLGVNTVFGNLVEKATADSEIFDKRIIEFLIQVFRFLVSLVVLVILYIAIAMPLNAPIYSLIFAEVFKIEKIRENPEFQINSVGSVFKRIAFSLGFEIKKLIVIIFVTILNLILGLLLGLIPVVGQIITVILQFLIFAFFGTIDIFEPVHSNELYRFRDRMAYLFKNPHLLPFAILGGILISIPLVNIVMLPIFVIAGILIWVEENH